MNPPASGRIYLAEDSRSVRLMLVDELTQAGFDVRSAENGESLWAMLLEEKPDLVVSDLEMPVLDGLSLCRRIKNTPEFRDIYFILLTHRSALSDRLHGLESGADDYVDKSAPREELFARIRAGLRVRSLQIELRRSLELLHQREKLTSIGQLAAGVAHSINNPIAFIASNLDTLRKYTDRLVECLETQSRIIEETCADGASRAKLDDLRKKIRLEFIMEDMPRLFAESREGVGRVIEIVNGLRDFTHVDSIGSLRIDINDALRRTLGVMRHALEGKTEVVTRFGDLPEVLCRPREINQVFLALLVNALDSLDVTPGRIIVETRTCGDQVEIAISDTGRGIPQKDRLRVFDPFFTTKKDTTGASGLGLSMAWNIVREHGGEILLDSEPGRGSCFTVRLPVTPETA